MVKWPTWIRYDRTPFLRTILKFPLIQLMFTYPSIFPRLVNVSDGFPARHCNRGCCPSHFDVDGVIKIPITKVASSDRVIRWDETFMKPEKKSGRYHRTAILEKLYYHGKKTLSILGWLAATSNSPWASQRTPQASTRRPIHIQASGFSKRCSDTQNSKRTYGGFLKWGYPQIILFNRMFYYKPSMLGYLHFRKPPYRSKYWGLLVHFWGRDRKDGWMG